MLLSIKRFLEDESGPTGAEYAFILALILMAVIGAVSAVGSSTAGLWSDNMTRIATAIS